MDINYIAEREAFYKWLRRNKLSLAAQSLWNALFTIANENGWPDGAMEVEVNMLLSDCHFTKSTLYKARDELRDKGLIDYEAGERNARCAFYKMCYLSFWSENQTKTRTREQTKTQTPDTKPKPKQERGSIQQQGQCAREESASADQPDIVELLPTRRRNYVLWLAEMDSDPKSQAEFAELLLGNRFSNDQCSMALTLTQSKHERRKVRDPTEYIKALLLDWEKQDLREKWEIEDYITASPEPISGIGCMVYDLDENMRGAYDHGSYSAIHP